MSQPGQLSHGIPPRGDIAELSRRIRDLERQLQQMHGNVVQVINGKRSGLFGTGVDQSGANANAGGSNTTATGDNSLAVGDTTVASGLDSVAEGEDTTASGDYSHAEGYGSTAEGEASHAEGNSYTGPSAEYSHAEGNASVTGEVAHGEGASTAEGKYSHAEGGTTTASGRWSHSEGEDTTASGDYSHAQGWASIAFRTAEHATAMQLAKALQRSEASITSDQGANDLNIGTGTNPLIVPVHDGHFDAKLTIFSDNMTDRWDITFRGDNDAVNFAGRDSGTVTIAASAGGSGTVYGSSTITWAVSGDSAGNVLITPSATTAGWDRYAHVELFELHASV